MALAPPLESASRAESARPSPSRLCALRQCPPSSARAAQVLLVADETALPALAGIVEELAACPTPPATQAIIEIPEASDRLPLPHWPGLDVRWAPRHGGAHGAGMTSLLAQILAPRSAAAAVELDEIDIETTLPWERSEGGADGFYAWVAGESAAVMVIRKHLLQERGLPRAAASLMGYWRLGRVIE